MIVEVFFCPYFELPMADWITQPIIKPFWLQDVHSTDWS